MEHEAYSLYRRGAALLSEGLPREAVDALARARTLEPQKASIREALGRAYFALGRAKNAEAEFAAAAEIDPANDYAHYGLALCFERQGRLDEARGRARMAAVMRPDNEDYRRAVERLERVGGPGASNIGPRSDGGPGASNIGPRSDN